MHLLHTNASQCAPKATGSSRALLRAVLGRLSSAATPLPSRARAQPGVSREEEREQQVARAVGGESDSPWMRPGLRERSARTGLGEVHTPWGGQPRSPRLDLLWGWWATFGGTGRPQPLARACGWCLGAGRSCEFSFLSTGASPGPAAGWLYRRPLATQLTFSVSGDVPPTATTGEGRPCACLKGVIL